MAKKEYILEESQKLKSSWSRRDRKFKNWLDLITLKPKRKARPGHGLFVSNDPRTYYNFAGFLLSTSQLTHKIKRENLDVTQAEDAANIEQILIDLWDEQDNRQEKRSRLGIRDQMISWLLLFGWISVLALKIDNEFVTEIWSPMNVYPEFSEDGLLRVAHVYSLSIPQARHKAKKLGWQIPDRELQETALSKNVTISDYWEDIDGVKHGICVGDSAVVPLKSMKLSRIPIFVQPVGGLSGLKEIDTTNEWQEYIGESILAPNETLYDLKNQYLTLTQDWLTDTAQPHIAALTQAEGVVTPENWERPGGIYKLQPGDDIRAVMPPPIPADLKMQQFEIDNEIQRGSVPYAAFGNIQQQMSTYMLSQITAGVRQNLQPYMKAIENVYESINRFFLELEDIGMPGELETSLRLNIASDIMQRAASARTLSPNFQISRDTTAKLLLPEVENMEEEEQKLMRDSVKASSPFGLINLITTLNNQAQVFQEKGDMQTAQLYAQMAQLVQAQSQNLIQQQPAAKKKK